MSNHDGAQWAGDQVSDRVRRPLRCGEPTVYEFSTEDGVTLRLTRFEGGARGPVILSPGFGTSSVAYTIDTVETNYPEYLYEHGYDVWVLDYRASPLLPSSATQFTLDDIARFDYPAAVDKVREESGADSVQVMAHCVGSLTMLMSLGLGLQGVRSAVASQLTLHPRAGALNQLRAGIFAADLISAVGIDVLSTEIDDDPSWLESLYDKALAFYPEGDEPCDRPFCRRAAFTFGESYDHDQLNAATHDHIGEDFLRERNDPALYSRHVIAGYAHMDCFVGKDASRDVYPLVTAQLDLHN